MQSVGGERITGKLYDPFVRADRGRLYSQPLPTLQLPAWGEGLNEKESWKVMSLKRAWHQKLGQLGRAVKRRVNPDLIQFVMKLIRRDITGKLRASGHTPWRPQLLEPPGADPHAGWCGRGNALRGVPYPVTYYVNLYHIYLQIIRTTIIGHPYSKYSILAIHSISIRRDERRNEWPSVSSFQFGTHLRPNNLLLPREVGPQWSNPYLS